VAVHFCILPCIESFISAIFFPTFPNTPWPWLPLLLPSSPAFFFISWLMLEFGCGMPSSSSWKGQFTLSNVPNFPMRSRAAGGRQTYMGFLFGVFNEIMGLLCHFVGVSWAAHVGGVSGIVESVLMGVWCE